MAAPWPSPLILTGGRKFDGTSTYTDYATAEPVGLPRLSSPIPGVATEYVLQQDFMQARASFSPLALNTAHPTSGYTPDFSSFVLVEESERQDIGGGLVRWTRTYAKAPTTHYEWEMFDYSFIGLYIDLGGGATQSRIRKSQTVLSQVEYDYILCTGSPVSYSDPITGTTHNVSGPGDIDVILDMQYVSQGTAGGIIYGGINLAVDSLNIEATGFQTWPTSEQYQGMISNALNSGWGGASKAKVIVFPTSASGHKAGTIDTSTSIPAGATYSGTPAGGIIPAQTSRLTRWKGNIYQRATRFVLAR